MAKVVNDLISRADAIEAVRGLSVLVDDEDFSYFEDALKALPSADAVKVAYICDGRKCDKDCSECFRTLDIEHARDFKRMGETYYQQESADAVQGWIPVEEQPPQFPCLVCDANGNQPSVPLGIVTITDEEHGEWHIDGRLWDTKVFFKGEWCSQTGYGNRIIAWMPLPKPYKGGDSK